MCVGGLPCLVRSFRTLFKQILYFILYQFAPLLVWSRDSLHVLPVCEGVLYLVCVCVGCAPGCELTLAPYWPGIKRLSLQVDRMEIVREKPALLLLI